MLAAHLRQVTDLLLQKKTEYEELNVAAGEQVLPALRSPPPLGRAALKSPKMPPLGYFSVSAHSPRSPRSPLKRAN
jgi:histone deacetylase 6